ncbi:hypothetical protein [Actinomadura gamaensis]|uniref:Uncharacterized protein n=1 Tax=Actinomadura gamaensis TaxID=1763541 RepID=A0ABV9U574_9ACTN
MLAVEEDEDDESEEDELDEELSDEPFEDDLAEAPVPTVEDEPPRLSVR